MKKYISMLIFAALIFAISGCAQKVDKTDNIKEDDKPLIESKEEKEDDDAAGQPKSEDESSGSWSDGDWNTSGLSTKQIEKIDWNTKAYTKYFRVDSMGTTFHYWNLETVVGILPNGDVLYMNEDKSIIVEADTGDVHISASSFTAAMVPDPEQAEYDPPLIPLAPDGSYNYTLAKDALIGGYVFSVDLGEYQNEYYINSNLVCIGWQITSEAGIASYSFNDPGFENVMDEVLPGVEGDFDAP